jgi:zona occludens toxin (predicted ATPase)
MNPNQKPVQEPNFEGELMKVPAAMQSAQSTPTSTSLINGPILILLVAILIALLGGIYYWYTVLMSEPLTTSYTRPTAAENNEPESTTAEARTAATDVVSTSDELDAIGADLESTRLDELESNLTTIDNEVGAATDETTPAETLPPPSDATSTASTTE